MLQRLKNLLGRIRVWWLARRPRRARGLRPTGYPPARRPLRDPPMVRHADDLEVAALVPAWPAPPQEPQGAPEGPAEAPPVDLDRKRVRKPWPPPGPVTRHS